MYYRMCSTDVYCSKQTGSSAGTSETITHHFPFWIRRKLSMQPKFMAQKMLLNRNSANIRKWIARFYYFRHLYPLEARCIAHNNCKELPIDMGNSICTGHNNILLGSFQLFLHSDSLSEGEIISSAVRQSGGGCIIHAGGGGGFTHWLTDRFDARKRQTTTSGNIITQSIIFSFLASR